MADQSSANFTVVGSEKGTVKELGWHGGTFVNLNDLNLDWSQRVVHLSWNNPDETEILVGRSCGAAEIVSLADRNLVHQGSCSGLSEGASMQGIARLGSSFVSGFDDGSISCWRWNDSNECDVVKQVSCGSSLACIHGDTSRRHEVATGGKQNNLKLWDAERLDKSVFAAKNVRNDFLDLEVPIWVQSVCYPTDSLVAVGTAYHEVQLYDPRAQRRPITRYEWGEHPIVTMDSVPEKSELIVANTCGDMALLDLRSGTLQGQFRGACGTIRHVLCHQTQPLVLSCSLDRYIRLHHTTTRKLVKEVYVKQRMCSGLLPSAGIMDLSSSMKRTRSDSAKKNVSKVVANESDDDDDVWESIPLAEEDDTEALPRKKKKRVKA